MRRRAGVKLRLDRPVLGPQLDGTSALPSALLSTLDPVREQPRRRQFRLWIRIHHSWRLAPGLWRRLVGFLGEISADGFFDGRHDDAERDWPALRRVYLWYRFLHTNPVLFPMVCSDNGKLEDKEKTVNHQYRDAMVFAALEGLPCPQERVQPVFIEVAGDGGSTDIERRKAYQAPLKFDSRKELFRAFLEFNAILNSFSSADLALGLENIMLRLRQKIDRSRAAEAYCSGLMAKLAEERALIALPGEYQHDSCRRWAFRGGLETRGNWVGTAPLGALPGDHVVQMPRMEGCMVLRPTGNDGEHRVVGCALLPMAVPGRRQGTIVLV